MPEGLSPADPVGLASRPPVIGRVATATITLVCVLVIYDGWSTLRLVDAVVIVVGPIVAIFTSHVYSSSLVQLVELGRRPNLREWLVTIRFESRFLLLAVPPLVVLLVLALVGVELSDSIQAIIVLEALLLGFWAGLGAWYAGLRGRPLALAVLAGLVVSCIILLLQVTLQPGRARTGGGSDGTARIAPTTPRIELASSTATIVVKGLTLTRAGRLLNDERQVARTTAPQ